jgi:hypothetical protein
MTSYRLLKNSFATAALAAAFVVTPILAQAQDSASPPPDQQYGNPNPYPGQYQGQSAPPANGMQYDATMQSGAPQPGAPQGIEQAPPAIPDYQQPPSPGDGYIWTPGYWAWTGDGYEWIQGAWVAAPYTGALWTPGYWGDDSDGYFWNAGYWGPYVGYYGGINYGFGYFGIGFYGGYWGGGRFWYNRAYCNYRGGFGYSRAYNGYSGHPGGASFVHSTAIAANRGAGSAAYRGSSINGRTSSYAQGASRASYNGVGNYSAARSYTGASSYSGAARSYAPSQSYSGAARSYSAPSAGSYGGGGFHGGGMSGGGGGFHGGGGGHR